MSKVRCLRCGFQIGETLHRIIATDGFSCPRCEQRDGVAVPMVLSAS